MIFSDLFLSDRVDNRAGVGELGPGPVDHGRAPAAAAEATAGATAAVDEAVDGGVRGGDGRRGKDFPDVLK